MNLNLIAWAGAAAVGAWGLSRIFASPPMKSGSVAAPVSDRVVSVLGRQTFIDAPAGATRILIFWHGFGGSAAVMGPKLARLLGGAPAALVVPQLGPKSEIGDLSSRMTEYISAVRAVVGLPSSPIDGVSHSGGYRALAAMIRQTRVNGVGLLDSLYGELPTFQSGKFDCLIDVYGSETKTLSQQLQAATVGNFKYQILETTTPHTEMPAMYLGRIARALPTCAGLIGTK